MLKHIAKIILVIIGSTVLCCCNHSDNNNGSPSIIFNQSDKIGKIDLSEISDNYLIFQPETTKESLISKIFRIWDYKSHIYILDNRNRILVFNSSGKYLWKLTNQGNGPGEYTRLMDFAIDQIHDQILLLDYGKILRYDLNGNYIDCIRINEGYEISTNGKYAYIKSFDEENGTANSYSLKIIDLETLAVTDDLPAINNCAPSCNSNMQTLTFSNGKVLLSRKFDSKIYALSNKNVSTVFDIDWGECAFPNITDKKYDCNEFFKLSRENNYIFSIGDIIMSDSLCLFKTNLNSFGLIDKTNNTIKLATSITDSRLFPDIAPPLKPISINGDLPEIAIVINSSNANFFASKCTDPKIATVLNTMEEDDNSVLILSTLK